jgi:hypothetical protein
MLTVCADLALASVDGCLLFSTFQLVFAPIGAEIGRAALA